jgi:hypothetical protein
LTSKTINQNGELSLTGATLQVGRGSIMPGLEVDGGGGVEFIFHNIAPYFIVLLCLTPDNFTHQEVSAGAQWVK